MNFYASSLFPERCDRLLFVIVTMPESVHLHDYSIPVDDMDNHLGTWSLLRLFPTFSRNRPPDNRITHAGGGKGDRPLVIQCQDSKKEPHHFRPCVIPHIHDIAPPAIAITYSTADVRPLNTLL